MSANATALPNVSADETRQIAREANINGFPIVDEYLTMYAFSVDKKNPQYKGPFNSILNFARVSRQTIALL